MIKQSRARTLFLGGIVFTTIVSLWPIFMVASEVQGTLDEQLLQIAISPRLYMANFFVASLIAPALMVLMLTYAFSMKTHRDRPLFNSLSALFLAAYATLASISYMSQYTYLPRILANDALEMAPRWFFLDSSSHAYFLNQLGYACFGMAALLIGYKLLDENGLPRAIGVLLWLSALLSLVAFAGLLLDVKAQGLLSIISGILTLPVGVLSIIWGRRLLHNWI